MASLCNDIDRQLQIHFLKFIQLQNLKWHLFPQTTTDYVNRIEVVVSMLYLLNLLAWLVVLLEAIHSLELALTFISRSLGEGRGDMFTMLIGIDERNYSEWNAPLYRRIFSSSKSILTLTTRQECADEKFVQKLSKISHI